MENQQIEQQTTQPESELKNWIEKNGFQYSFSGIDAKVFLHRDNELIRLIVADDNRNIQLVNTSNIYQKISYDWQNTPENFAKLDNDFQTMKDSLKIIANLNEYTATQGGVFLSNTQSEKENTMNTENDTIFKFNNGYTITISDKLEQQVRKQGEFVEVRDCGFVWYKDAEQPVAQFDYEKKRGEIVPYSRIFFSSDFRDNDRIEVDILGNQNWKENLARAMVDFAVSHEVETGLNADKQFSGSPEIVSVTRDNYAAANRYAQNAAKNPIFLEKIDNRHQPVMPFDDFVAAVMKDTGDSRDEVVELASEAFRSQYQAASGYLRGVSDGSVMYNAFDIEIDDKTYYATAPLEWAKEQARVGLSDRGWDLENARHNFLHSSLDEWETAFHQLKAAADDYQQWRNQVCAFFNFRQPEITLQQDEWTQVAQFVNYNQEWEQLDNARLMIAEFTPQQAFEFLGVYQQYQRYVSLAEHNAEQGIDSPELRTQIAALEHSLNEKVAQNLPQTENRQVLFDLFGTQMNLFDEIEKTQEQGTTTPEKNNLDDLDELHIKFTNALEELSPEKQAELYPLVRDLGFEFIRLRQDCKELRAGNVEKSLNKIFELQNAIISKRQDYFVKGNDTDLAIEQAEHNRRVLMFVFKTKVGDRDFVEKLNDINYDFYKIIETHYQQTPAGQNDLFKRLDSELSRLNERLVWLRRNLETEKSFLQQAESSNVAVEVEYHKQTIDSINVGIAKNETEQNKLKLDANGFNQTPESQVLLQQLKEKFPHLWQSETQEQGISASAIPENSQETQPETVSGSIETEKQGTTTPENSDRLPENAWKAVPKEKIKEERKDEYFTTPKVLERSNYWIVDNGVVVTLDQYSPMYNRHMTIKTFNTVEEAKEYAERFFWLEQGISASAIPENSQETQPETVSGSLKDLQDELAWQNLYVVQFNNQRMLKKGYDHLTEQQVIDKDNELFEKEVQAQTRAAELMNEITQIVIGDEYANAKVPFANVVVQRDDRLLSYIKKVSFDFENKPNSLDERRLGLRHSMQIVFENAMDRMSENHLFVENFIDTSRVTYYLADLIDKNVIKSKDELFNHIVPIFNSAEFVKNQESVEYQQWQKAIKNSLTSFSFKTKNEVIEQIERYGVSDKFVAEKRQVGVRKENYYWVAIEKQGTTTPEISETVAVSQDLTGQPETQVPVVLTKEEKAQLKAAKAALTAAKKELKGLRDEFDSKQGYSYFNTQQAEDNIVQKQVEVAELQRNYDNLYLALYGKTGELTNLEKEILSARNLFQSALFQGDDETLLKSLFGRIEIIERELKEQLNAIRGQHAELKQRQNDKQVFEFEIQSVMQDALAYFERNPHKKLYHNNQPLPLETDRDKAIAYVLKGTMVEELNGLVSQENSIIRKLRAFQKVYLSRPNDKMFLPQEVKFHNTLETAENQLMKGSIEDRAEINLTYDINTPDGEKKVRELFYGSRHDEAQAELFERVFAMAQKLGVEVRHALRDSGENKEINKTVLGQYSLDKNSARVKHNGYIKPEQKGEVLLHELVHSVTSRAMLLKEQGHTELLNPAQVKAIEEIEKIYKLVTEKAEELGVKGDYGLTNSHEMIAELANPVFRDKLKQIGVFDDTVGKITEVSTGVSHTETAYDRLNKALYQIMDNYEPDFGEKWQQAKYSNIKMNDIFRQPEQPQEQTMKSSQEVLAEVMNKYEKHIDSKDGLMNKPLHWLSAAELEDRRTVIASRIDSAIQNDDHKTEKRLELEYIKVENERERRENLSGDLKEQTATQGGISSPENSADEIKHDIFTQAENVMTEQEEHHLFIGETMAKYPVKDGEPFVIVSAFDSEDYPHYPPLSGTHKMSIQATEMIFTHLDNEISRNGEEFVQRFEICNADGVAVNSINLRQYELGRNNGGLFCYIASCGISYHDDLSNLSQYLTQETRNGLIERIAQQAEVDNAKKAVADEIYPKIRIEESKKVRNIFGERLQQQIQQQITLPEQQRRENLSGNLKEPTATQGGISSPENSADKIKHDIFTQAEKDTIFEFDNGYTVVIADKLEQQVRKQGEFVEVRDCGFVWHKDAKKPVAQFDYEKKRGEIVPYSRIFFSSDFRDNNRIEVDVLNNSNWKNDLVEEMVDFAVRREHITKLNAELDNSWNYKLVSVTQGVVGKNHPNKGGIFSPETKLGESPNAVKQDAFGLPETDNQMEQTTQAAYNGGIVMAEPVLAEKTAEEMKEIINDLLQQRSEQMGNKHLSSDIATLMVYVQTDNPTAEETQAVKDLGVVKNFVENNMQYQKWYAPTPQDEIRRLSENTVKHDMNGLPEKPVHIDLDTPYIVAFPDDIKPNDPNANKTLGELMKQNDGVMWDAEFWGDRVGTGEMTVSENFITQVIATQRSEVLEEITTCGNVPFTKEHIEALYQREPELIKEVADDYAVPEIKALAKEVVQTAEIGLKKQAFNNAFALFQVADKINALEKRLQKQPNMINGQTELKELKHEQGELEKEYDKLTNRAFDAGISLTKIRNGAKRQHAEFSGKPIQTAEVKQDAFGLPETTKTLSLQEQALADGKRLQQADEKVKSAEWECAKKPNIKEPYNNLQAAIAERDALNEEIKPRVQAAMDSGKPYIVDYSEDGKPLELVVTQNGNLKMALGSYEKEPNHNYLLSTANGEVALNAEQRSTPERVAEVLKYNFKHGCIDIGDKLALINYPAADKVFSEKQIKDTLNKCLKSSFKDIRLDAIKSPVMRGEWLQSIAANPKALDEIRQAAKNEMAERYGTPETMVEQPTEKIGVSSPEHEEELATVADDDYERD